MHGQWSNELSTKLRMYESICIPRVIENGTAAVSPVAILLLIVCDTLLLTCVRDHWELYVPRVGLTFTNTQ